MAHLFQGTITSAGTVIGGTITGLYDKDVVGAAAIFDYGSGGTNVKAYLQTSLDGGANWFDVSTFAFATSDAIRYVSLGRPAMGTATITPTDGSLTDDTIVPLAVGDSLRCKVVSTGTYAGATTLRVDANIKRP